MAVYICVPGFWDVLLGQGAAGFTKSSFSSTVDVGKTVGNHQEMNYKHGVLPHPCELTLGYLSTSRGIHRGHTIKLPMIIMFDILRGHLA